MLSYVLIAFFIEIGYNNIMEGSNIAFESVKFTAILLVCTNLPQMAQSYNPISKLGWSTADLSETNFLTTFSKATESILLQCETTISMSLPCIYI